VDLFLHDDTSAVSAHLTANTMLTLQSENDTLVRQRHRRNRRSSLE